MKKKRRNNRLVAGTVQKENVSLVERTMRILSKFYAGDTFQANKGTTEVQRYLDPGMSFPNCLQSKKLIIYFYFYFY